MQSATFVRNVIQEKNTVVVFISLVGAVVFLLPILIIQYTGILKVPLGFQDFKILMLF